MQRNDNAFGIQIHKDKMRLAVTNIHPVFQKKTEQEIRQEICAKLYRIFKKYVDV